MKFHVKRIVAVAAVTLTLGTAGANAHAIYAKSRDVIAAINYPPVMICDPSSGNCAAVNSSGALSTTGGGGGGSSGSITAAGVNGTLAQAVQGITGGVPVPVSIASSVPVTAATTLPVSIATTVPVSLATTLPVAQTAGTTATANYNYILGSNGTSVAGVASTGEQYVQISSGGTVAGQGLSLASGVTTAQALNVRAFCDASNGTSADPCRKDTYTAGPLWMTTGGSTTSAIASGTTGPTVVKGSAGRLVQLLVTTAGTSSETCYDNASAGSGTIIGITPTTTSVGTELTFNTPAANGITCTGSTGSPALTVSYF